MLICMVNCCYIPKLLSSFILGKLKKVVLGFLACQNTTTAQQQKDYYTSKMADLKYFEIFFFISTVKINTVLNFVVSHRGHGQLWFYVSIRKKTLFTWYIGTEFLATFTSCNHRQCNLRYYSTSFLSSMHAHITYPVHKCSLL